MEKESDRGKSWGVGMMPDILMNRICVYYLRMWPAWSLNLHVTHHSPTNPPTPPTTDTSWLTLSWVFLGLIDTLAKNTISVTISSPDMCEKENLQYDLIKEFHITWIRSINHPSQKQTDTRKCKQTPRTICCPDALMGNIYWWNVIMLLVTCFGNVTLR